MIKQYVKFIADAWINIGRPDIQEKLFSEGDIVELPSPSARRWIRRNIAVEFVKPKSVRRRSNKNVNRDSDRPSVGTDNDSGSKESSKD